MEKNKIEDKMIEIEISEKLDTTLSDIIRKSRISARCHRVSVDKIKYLLSVDNLKCVWLWRYDIRKGYYMGLGFDISDNFELNVFSEDSDEVVEIFDNLPDTIEKIDHSQREV